jgi:hypothetical protein
VNGDFTDSAAAIVLDGPASPNNAAYTSSFPLDTSTGNVASNAPSGVNRSSKLRVIAHTKRRRGGWRSGVRQLESKGVAARRD